MSEQPPPTQQPGEEQPGEDPGTTGSVDPNEDAGQSLPPPPKPRVEPPAPPPGGPHAVPGVGGEGAYSTAARDPDPRHNPATDHELPAETTQGEDTDTAATRATPDSAGEVASTGESPA